MTNDIGLAGIASDTLGNILQTRKRLRVPVNQRSYAGAKEHVDDLYKDLKGAIADGAEAYFVGAMVGVGSGESERLYDGQQRLATIMMLIAAIRDYFFQIGDEKTAGIIERESLFSESRGTHEEVPHFQLNTQDNQFFIHRVLKRPDSAERKTAKPDPRKDSNRKINDAAGQAAILVREITTGFHDERKASELNQWLDFIVKSLRVIWVQVADQRTAFTVFFFFNDRGLKLSAADLLKNYLYGTADDRQDEVIQKWDSMTGILQSIEKEESEIVEYIRTYWVSTHGPTRSKDLYDKIKAEANNKTKAIALATKLETRSLDYAALLTSSQDTWASYGPGVKSDIETLQWIGVTQVRPLLLSAFGVFSEKEFAKLIHICVSWSVRILLTGVPSGTIEGYYSRNALKITDKKITTVDAVAEDMVGVVPDDERFRAAVKNVNVANGQLSRYYLRVLQRQADGEKEPQYLPNDGREITLEHVMPKRPTPGQWAHIPPDDLKANVNKLGNQALLQGSVNSKLGTLEYSEKKSAFTGSEFSLTRDAAQYSEWNLATISERQKKLADLAVRAWPLRIT